MLQCTPYIQLWNHLFLLWKHAPKNPLHFSTTYIIFLMLHKKKLGTIMCKKLPSTYHNSNLSQFFIMTHQRRTSLKVNIINLKGKSNQVSNKKSCPNKCVCSVTHYYEKSRLQFYQRAPPAQHQHCTTSPKHFFLYSLLHPNFSHTQFYNMRDICCRVKITSQQDSLRSSCRKYKQMLCFYFILFYFPTCTIFLHLIILFLIKLAKGYYYYS